MTDQEAKEFLSKYEAGNCNDFEKALVEQWLFQFNQEQVGWSDERLTAVRQEVWQKLPQQQVRQINWWPRVAAAASILICLSIGFYLLKYRSTELTKVNLQAASVLPGGNKAVLTLGNGKQIVLTTAKNGQLAVEGGAAINKTADGNLVYNSAQSDRVSDALIYNTINTPKGGQYHLTLADGTGVWLNAASSIKYPAVFTGNKRSVEITGEAYFEVAHNADKPFRVTFNEQTVEVLGTHFNINAYADEPKTKTTLLEGKIKLAKVGYTAVLSPGQEANLAAGGYQVKEADLEQAIAWKNGLFHFDNTDVKTLMRQVSRWYDVEVAYDGKTTDYKFAGDLRRNTNLADLLQILEQGGIHFRIEGRKLIVTS